MNLRERAEKAWNVWKFDEDRCNAPNELFSKEITNNVESFAKEIRNEALEEAVGILEQQRFGEIETDIRGLIYLIRDLKEIK